MKISFLRPSKRDKNGIANADKVGIKSAKNTHFLSKNKLKNRQNLKNFMLNNQSIILLMRYLSQKLNEKSLSFLYYAK